MLGKENKENHPTPKRTPENLKEIRLNKNEMYKEWNIPNKNSIIINRVINVLYIMY